MEPEKSFNDAMNDWAARQSFFRNTGNRIIHPDPNLPWFFRMLGYLFRLGVVAFFAVVIGRVGLKKYVMSGGFSERAAESFAKQLKADEFESSSLFWKGNRVSLKQFKAKGSQESVFRSLQADYVQFESNPLKLLGETWDLGDVVISGLAIEFRSGALTEVPLSMSGASLESARLLMAGLGSAPDFSKVEYGVISVKEAKLDWGLSETTRGGYSGALEFREGEKGDDWQLDLTGGIFHQNWMRNVTVERLTVRRKGGELLFEDGLLIFENGGSAAVEGKVALGGLPEADIKLQLIAVNLQDFIPREFKSYLDGRVSGELKMTGSINTRAGIRYGGILNISDGRIRNLRVFESLALLTQVARFRQMPLSSGTFRLRTGGDELTVEDMDFKAEEFGALRGGFKVSRSSELTAEEQLINEQLRAEGKELKKVPYHVDGELKIGVTADKLIEYKAVADKYFEESGADFSWMSVYLTGKAEQLTNGVYEEMVNGVKELRKEKL